jgi:hypothetical protein
MARQIQGIHDQCGAVELSLYSKGETCFASDMYSLDALGFPIDQVKQPKPDLLATVRYSCVYWVNHLCASSENAGQDDGLQDSGAIDNFVRKKYLYWLEALSLCRSMSDGVVSMAKLEALIEVILRLVMLCIYSIC